VVAHAWSQAAADRAADALAARIEALEPEFAARLWSTQDGVREALRLAHNAAGPVVIADTQDNPGAGGSGDTTGILRELLHAGAQGAMLGLLCDAHAAQAAHRAGEGAQIEIALGGRHGPDGVTPLRARYRVLRLGNGRFRTTGSVAGNMDADLGPMALLQCEGVGIVVTSRRMQAYDPAPFLHLGVDPAAQRILVLKSTCHFRADFEPIASAVLTVLAPGAYLADPADYPYRRLRSAVRLRPLGPPHGAG
jgi:microcystin degradation protein MlrC